MQPRSGVALNWRARVQAASGDGWLAPGVVRFPRPRPSPAAHQRLWRWIGAWRLTPQLYVDTTADAPVGLVRFLRWEMVRLLYTSQPSVSIKRDAAFCSTVLTVQRTWLAHFPSDSSLTGDTRHMPAAPWSWQFPPNLRQVASTRRLIVAGKEMMISGIPRQPASLTHFEKVSLAPLPEGTTSAPLDAEIVPLTGIGRHTQHTCRAITGFGVPPTNTR